MDVVLPLFSFFTLPIAGLIVGFGCIAVGPPLPWGIFRYRGPASAGATFSATSSQWKIQ